MIATVAKQNGKSAFGRRLRAIREAKGLSQETLGELAGMPYQSIAKYERGENVPNWNTVEKLADALGVKTDEFRDDAE